MGFVQTPSSVQDRDTTGNIPRLSADAVPLEGVSSFD